MGLINETNRQYYAGAQSFQAVGTETEFQFTFDEQLELYDSNSWNPTDPAYSQNNFIFEYSLTGADPYAAIAVEYSVLNNKIILATGTFTAGYYRVRLKDLNYGDYSYISIDDIINNFLMIYVGEGKLVPSMKRTDLIFFAKRAMQEFSYDTLKSVKAQELTIPNNLSVPLPQDYVNYVKASWTDDLGVKHVIYPTRLTSNPTEMPIQDGKGIPTQDNFDNNIEGTSITEEKWKAADMKRITGAYDEAFDDASIDNFTYNRAGKGQRYGLNPETTQVNGFFTINERERKFSFSSDLVGKVIIFEYISDGLAYDTDMRVPKMAEDAFYSHILYSVLSGRVNIPEYIINRVKREKSAKLRNTKIRLSNIKLEEITQVFRNKSKIIKH